MIHTILAPFSGETMPLGSVPDEAFAAGMLGEGLAIAPEGERAVLHAPIDGRLAAIAEAKHAYTFSTDGGMELLVHVGIDTVTLKGAPFMPLIAAGTAVTAGQAVAEVDLAAIRTAGLPTVTPILLCEGGGKLVPVYCHAEAGQSTVATVED